MIEFDEATGHDFSTLDFMAARQAYERGEWEAALALFESSNERSPHAKTFFFIAKILDHLGRHDASHEAIAQAYELNPNNSLIAVEYARKLVQLNETDKAKAILEATIEHNRTYNPARRLLAELP